MNPKPPKEDDKLVIIKFERFQVPIPNPELDRLMKKIRKNKNKLLKKPTHKPKT